MLVNVTLSNQKCVFKHYYQRKYCLILRLTLQQSHASVMQWTVNNYRNKEVVSTAVSILNASIAVNIGLQKVLEVLSVSIA